MKRIAFVAAAVLVAVSCDQAPTGPAPADITAQSEVTAATGPTAFCEVPRFDPRKFSNPTRINNRFLPLIPGTRTVLEGTANRGRGEQPHRVLFTVTDVTKVIHGVRTV